MTKFVFGYSQAKRALLLAGVLAVACCPLWARNGEPPAGQMRQRGGNQDRELQQLTQTLQLTTDQQAQVKTLLADQRQKMMALRQANSDTSATPQTSGREQMEAIRNDTNTKINALLNDDQKTQFAAWLQERKQQMEGHQSPGGDNAPPSSPPSL
jgi:Spy/CpxP family protein refolding chaperone